MAEPTIIECRNLEFSYPDGNKALKNVTLTVARGEKIALIGPNGAGKSTLLQQLNGILRGVGSVQISNMELSNKTLALIRRKVGMVFQDPNDQLFCPTVFDDVAFGPLHFGLSPDEINALVSQSLSRVGLTGFEEKSGHHLSLGERKRVAIATVLACKPDILLLDEPTANLDPKHRREMINMIQAWDYTTIIATHDLDLAWDTCSRCIILNSGAIRADAPITEILKNSELLGENDLELPLRFQSNPVLTCRHCEPGG